MTNQNQTKSNTDAKPKSDAKQAKLAEALRANLRKRKSQTRDRKNENS